MSRLLRSAVLGLSATAVLALPAAAGVTDSTVSVDPAPVAHGPVTVTGTVDRSAPGDGPYGRAQLRLVAGDQAVEVATAPLEDSGTARWSFTTAPCAPEALCGGATVLPNGPRVLQLWEVDRVGGERQVAEGTVLVDVPAGRPQDVAATISGRRVTVRWARAGLAPVRDGEQTKDVAVVEPDVVWAVSDGHGRIVSATPSDCADGVCATTITYPDGESGARRYTVLASRPCNGCSAAPTASQPSGELVVPVVPGATPSTPAGGSASPRGAAGADGGRADLRSLGGGLGTFSPGLGTPVLPSLEPGGPPAVAAPRLPDTFDETLGYDDRTALEPVPAPQAARPATRLTSTGGGVLGDEQVVRGVAGALVLALSGAHLRTWLAASRRELEV